ncbi:hypothetical protein C8R47DRAFT_1209420 [Mycena vitilis]|nr:hypothetical protein C8R47DRAFT_1209420 [Mycena vitilis]
MPARASARARASKAARSLGIGASSHRRHGWLGDMKAELKDDELKWRATQGSQILPFTPSFTILGVALSLAMCRTALPGALTRRSHPYSRARAFPPLSLEQGDLLPRDLHFRVSASFWWPCSRIPASPPQMMSRPRAGEPSADTDSSAHRQRHRSCAIVIRRMDTRRYLAPVMRVATYTLHRTRIYTLYELCSPVAPAHDLASPAHMLLHTLRLTLPGTSRLDRRVPRLRTPGAMRRLTIPPDLPPYFPSHRLIACGVSGCSVCLGVSNAGYSPKRHRRATGLMGLVVELAGVAQSMAMASSMSSSKARAQAGRPGQTSTPRGANGWLVTWRPMPFSPKRHCCLCFQCRRGPPTLATPRHVMRIGAYDAAPARMDICSPANSYVPGPAMCNSRARLGGLAEPRVRPSAPGDVAADVVLPGTSLLLLRPVMMG